MKNSKDLPEKKGTPPMSKQAAFSKASSHFKEAFETIVEVMRTSQNPSDKLGAAKIIINKVLPDLKAVEMDGKDGGAIKIMMIPYGNNNSPSTETEGSV